MFKKTTFFLSAIVLIGVGCHKNNNNTSVPWPVIQANYQQTNLVADTATYGAAAIDPVLLNAWGIAINPTGIVWISANHGGATTVYDSTGKTLLGPVAIPSQGGHFGGSPSGIVFNSTTDFVIPANQKVAKFIFVNEDGRVSAWNGGDSTLTVADRSSFNAVYKGVAIANDGTANFLYAANFKGGKIDVFDKTFQFVSNKPFADP
ncbi:MAG: TIGR03118 family protein, partial [Bacteroidota bacterium]|nr:TIGR03118 family protein [Bacteroidota bacterium]